MHRILARSGLAAVGLFAPLFAAGCAAEAREPDAHDPAPPQTLIDVDGAPHELAGVLASGRCVVLVFWQSWCAPCRAEAPALAAAAREHAGALYFLGVVSGPDAVVDEGELRRVARELGTPYPHVRDRDGSLSRRYGVTGTPTLIALGPEGRVLWRGHHAPRDWSPLLGGRAASAAPRARASAEGPDGLGRTARAAEVAASSAVWRARTVQGAQPQVLRTRELGLMGTELLLEVIGPDPDALERALDAAIAELRRVEDLMTDWRPSPLTLLNEAAGTGAALVPMELARLVARGLEVSRLTGGAFDMTYAAAGRLWDFKQRPPRVPSPEEVRAALAAVGWERVSVDLEASTIALPPGASLGLGGIAKGYGVDRAMAVLMKHGVEHALVNAGGDLKALGRKLGEPWRIAIRHPRDRERALAVLPVSNVCVVTSGDYDRFFEHEGRRYHHILDPRTGYPSTGCMSATVVAPDAAFADALATALCVLGPQEGLAVVESLRRVEALLVDMEGEVHASSGLFGAARAKDGEAPPAPGAGPAGAGGAR